MEVERPVPVQGAPPLLCRQDDPGTASRSCPMGGQPGFDAAGSSPGLHIALIRTAPEGASISIVCAHSGARVS